MNKLLFYISFLFCITLCNAQTLDKVNDKSKAFTKKAMDLMDSVYVLRKPSDTLKYMKAITYLDSSIYLDSTNYFAFWKESELLFKLKKNYEALQIITKYTKSHKDNVNFLLREAYLCDKIGETVSAKTKYNKILCLVNEGLLKEKANKKLMIGKYLMLLLLEDSAAGDYLVKIKGKFQNDKEINNLVIFSKSFDKNKFLDYQLSGGESEDIQIQ